MAIHKLISTYKYCNYRQHGIYTFYVIIKKIGQKNQVKTLITKNLQRLVSQWYQRTNFDSDLENSATLIFWLMRIRNLPEDKKAHNNQEKRDYRDN